ncbi:MAG: hypothetical protein ACMXX8_00520, partial [Candidatus Woesearchaeota archaeon]
LIIFGSIFYVLMPKEENIDDETTATEVINNFFSQLKTKLSFKNLSNPFAFLSNINIRRYISPTSCTFRRNFECTYFRPIVEQNILLFEFRNILGREVVIKNIQINGEISCEKEINKNVKNLESITITMKNCTFDGIESEVVINHHDHNPNFLMPSRGRIIVKE